LQHFYRKGNKEKGRCNHEHAFDDGHFKIWTVIHDTRQLSIDTNGIKTRFSAVTGEVFCTAQVASKKQSRLCGLQAAAH
jgi:hypothetical protein